MNPTATITHPAEILDTVKMDKTAIATPTTYGMVRGTPGSDINALDPATLARTPDLAMQKADKMDRDTPEWAKRHPMIGIVEVKLTISRIIDQI